MNEYGGIDMKLAKGHGGGHAKSIDPNQGGNKAAPRGGAGKSIDSHTLVDRINHGCESLNVKNPMGDGMPVVGKA